MKHEKTGREARFSFHFPKMKTPPKGGVFPAGKSKIT